MQFTAPMLYVKTSILVWICPLNQTINSIHNLPTNLTEKVRNKLEKLENLPSDLAVSTAAPNVNYRLTDEILNKNIVWTPGMCS